MPHFENVTQSGISCYITRNWATVKSILDKELQIGSKAIQKPK
jgi:hypothetical protein